MTIEIIRPADRGAVEGCARPVKVKVCQLCSSHYQRLKRHGDPLASGTGRGSNRIDLTGKRFGALTVVILAESPVPGKRFWQCICDCGREVIVAANNLRSGNSKSCGCMKPIRIAEARTKHGHSPHGKPSREYTSWSAMLTRCTNPENHKFPDYGGRGISVCPQWQSFENFLADMGPRPEGTTLDRIEVDGNYEPGNCRWATPKVQANNQRRHKERNAHAG